MWKRKVRLEDGKDSSREIALNRGQQSISEAVDKLVQGIQELQSMNEYGEPNAER